LDYDDTASVGDSCSAGTDCNDAQACIATDPNNPEDTECRDKCTEAGDGPCSGSECQPLMDSEGNELDYGVCPAS